MRRLTYLKSFNVLNEPLRTKSKCVSTQTPNISIQYSRPLKRKLNMENNASDENCEENKRRHFRGDQPIESSSFLNRQLSEQTPEEYAAFLNAPFYATSTPVKTRKRREESTGKEIGRLVQKDLVVTATLVWHLQRIWPSSSQQSNVNREKRTKYKRFACVCVVRVAHVCLA